MNTFTVLIISCLCRLLTHQLYGYHEDGLQGESAVTEVEQILQAGAEKLQDHGVVLPARPEIKHLRNPFCRKQTNKNTRHL